MKKIYLTLLICLATGWAIAQDDGYKMWLGGTVNYTAESDDGDNDETSLMIGPSVGYNINKSLAVGLGIGFQSSESNDLASRRFEVGPFVRYYKSLSDVFSVYGALNIGFGSGSDEVMVGTIGTETEDDDYSFFGAEISPGVQFWMNKRWSINAELGLLGYSTHNDKEDDVTPEDFKSNEFYFGIDMNSISFSLNYHFLQ